MDAVIGIAIVLAVISIYFFPATTAFNRGHGNTLAIFAANLLLGWTLIGWALCLVWALTGPSVEREKPRTTEKPKRVDRPADPFAP